MHPTTVDSTLDDKISNIKSQLAYVKKARKDERHRFTENQTVLAQRQHFYLQELNKLQEPKVWMAPYYSRVMHELSCFDESPYVISRETELCQALHRVELITNQWRLLVDHHNSMMNSLKRKLEEETKLSGDLEDELLRSIKFSSIDMTGTIIENRAIIDDQKQQISFLKGETNNTEDSTKKRHMGPAGNQLSAAWTTPDNLSASKRDHREDRRVNTEKRIIEVGSYFTNIQTAEAA